MTSRSIVNRAFVFWVAVTVLAPLLLAPGASGAVYNCTFAERNTINPLTGLPTCLRVGLLATDAPDTQFFSHTLPERLFQQSTRGVLGVNISIEQTNFWWAEGIDAVERGDYDAFVANVWVLKDRIRRVDFSVSYYRESIGLLYELPVINTKSQFLSIFDPFTGTVWLSIVVTMLVGWLVITAAEFSHPMSRARFGDDSDQPQLASRQFVGRSFVRGLFHAAMVPFGSMEYQAHTSLGRIASWVLQFFFMIVMAMYTANLASFLTIQPVQPLRTAAELMNYPILADPSGIASFITALGGTAMEASYDKLNAAGLKTTPAAQSVALSQTTLLNMTHLECDMAYSLLDFSVDNGIMFRQSVAVTAFKRVFDTNLMQLKEQGVLARWVSAGIHADVCTNTDGYSSDTLGFKNLSGVFLICGCMIAFFVGVSVIRLLIESTSSKRQGGENDEMDVADASMRVARPRDSGAIYVKSHDDAEEQELGKPVSPGGRHEETPSS